MTTAAVRARLRTHLSEAAQCLRTEWNPYIALLMRRTPRKPAVWLAVLLVGSFASVGVGLFFYTAVDQPGFRNTMGPNAPGRMLVFVLAYFHFVCGQIVMALLATVATRNEQQRRTLEGVLIAPMTPLELVLKKSVQVWLPMLLVSALLLPFYSLATLAGGVGLEDVLRWWLLITVLVSLQVPPAMMAFGLRRSTHLNRWMGYRILLFELMFVLLPMIIAATSGGGGRGRPPWFVFALFNFIFAGGGPLNLIARAWHGMWHAYPFFAFKLAPWVAMALLFLPMNIVKAYHSAVFVAMMPALNLGPTPRRMKPADWDAFETPHAAWLVQRKLMFWSRIVPLLGNAMLLGFLWPGLVTSGAAAVVWAPGLRDPGAALLAVLFVTLAIRYVVLPNLVPMPQPQMNLMFVGEDLPLAQRVRNTFAREAIFTAIYLAMLCVLGWQSPFSMPLDLLARLLVVFGSTLCLRAAVDVGIELASARHPWITRGPGDLIYLVLMFAPFALLLCPLDQLRALFVASPLFAFASLTPWTNVWLAGLPGKLAHPLPPWFVAPLVQLPLAALVTVLALAVARRGGNVVVSENRRRETFGAWLVTQLQRRWDNPVAAMALRRQVRRGLWDTPVFATVPTLLWALALALGFPAVVAWAADRLIPGLVADCATDLHKSLRLVTVSAWVVLMLEGLTCALSGFAVGCGEEAKRNSANFAMLLMSPLNDRAVLTGALFSSLIALLPVVVSCAPFLLGIPLVTGDGLFLTLMCAGLAWNLTMTLASVVLLQLACMFSTVGQVVLATVMVIFGMVNISWALLLVEAKSALPLERAPWAVLVIAAGCLALSLAVFLGCGLRLRRLRKSDVSLLAAVEN